MIYYQKQSFACVLLLLAATVPAKLRAQASTDLAVQQITLPPATVQVGQPIIVEFTVANLGNNGVNGFPCGVQIFNQANPGVPVFQNQVNVPNLAAGASQTLQTTQAWIPQTAGQYVVQVDILYPQDNLPANNRLTKNFHVETQGLLTLAQAIDILNAQVLDAHPRADSLMALHLSPPTNSSDSLIRPGMVIEGAELPNPLQYGEPVYFFFVDLYPEQLYGHPCEYVAISAVDGHIDRNASQIWPMIDDVVPDGGVLCSDAPPNPRLVRGGKKECAPKPNPYTPRGTSNKDDWALVVVGAIFKDVEETAVQHDICMYKERINGGQFGPGVTGENITVQAGENNRGLTDKELCAAIESFKGKACRKFYFKYVAHGVERDTYGNHDKGIVLWDSSRKKKVYMPWDTLACKLEEAGIRNICIEITSCYSGGILAALAKKKIRGVVMTSSSTARPTQVGDGSGTPWEKALLACSKDPEADLNKNDTIDAFELFAWVNTKNKSGNPDIDNPLWSDPQIRDMVDTTKAVCVSVDSIAEKRDQMNGNSGTIEVVQHKTAVWIRRPGEAPQNYVRHRIYLKNLSNKANRLNKSYQITVKCRDGIRVLKTYKVGKNKEEAIVFPANAYICIAEVPQDCINAEGKAQVDVVEIKDRIKSGEENEIQEALPDESYTSFIDIPVVHNPGEFGFHRYEFVPFDTNGSFRTSVETPDGWEPQLSVGAFRIPDGDTSHPVYTGVYIPDSATVGGKVTTTVSDDLTGDVSHIIYTVYLRDTLAASFDIEAQIDKNWRWYDIRKPTRLHSRLVTLRDVRIEAEDRLDMESVGSWSLNNVAISGGETAPVTIAVGKGSTQSDWRNVAVWRPQEGVVVEGGSVSMENVTVAASERDGMYIRGFDVINDTMIGTSVARLKDIEVIGAARHGIVFENLKEDTIRAEALRFSLIDSNDIVVANRTDVACLDCDYREEAVDVDATSSLSRYAKLSVAVVDTLGEGLAGAEIIVADSLGRINHALITDSSGLLSDAILLISRHDRNGFRQYAPFVVTVRYGTLEQQDTLSPVNWTQRVFTFGKESSSVPALGDERDHSAIVRVIPQPIVSDGEFVVETTGLGTRKVDATLYNSTGERVWEDRGLLLLNDHLKIRSLGKEIGPGIYLLQLDLHTGELLSMKVVIR